MKRKICTKPFEWMEIFNQPASGELYLCCPWWLPESIGNVSEQDARSLWHSDLASKIRQSVIDGSHTYCSKEYCPYLAEPDAPESPIKYVDEEEYSGYQLAVQQPELYLPAPKTMNCAYDRSCNLQCPSCRDEIMQASKDERSEYDVMIRKILDSFAEDLGTLYVTGSGDPFASRHLWELLSSDIAQKYPSLQFRLHTNAILFTEQRWEKMAHLHGRIEMVEVSIDGGQQASYEVNRYPAKWETLLERMAFIAGIRKQYSNLHLKINYVVQSNNWRDMKALIALAKDWNVDVIKFSKIVNWGTYSAAEYREVSIHEPVHPDYTAFKAFLNDPIFNQKGIMMDDFIPEGEGILASDLMYQEAV